MSAVGVVIGLASRAEITFFDEPYLGLDAVARQIFYDRLLADYVSGLRDLIAELAVGGGDAVASTVAERCATIGTQVSVTVPEGTALVGRALRLDPDGRLVVATVDGAERIVGAGDVVHVR